MLSRPSLPLQASQTTLTCSPTLWLHPSLSSLLRRESSSSKQKHGNDCRREVSSTKLTDAPTFFLAFQKSVSYSGTNHRLRRILRRAMNGESIAIAVLGGSSSSLSSPSSLSRLEADIPLCFRPQSQSETTPPDLWPSTIPTMLCFGIGGGKRSRMQTILTFLREFAVSRRVASIRTFPSSLPSLIHFNLST